MIEKVLDLPEGFLTDYQPKIQQGSVKTMLIEGGKAMCNKMWKLATRSEWKHKFNSVTCYWFILAMSGVPVEVFIFQVRYGRRSLNTNGSWCYTLPKKYWKHISPRFLKHVLCLEKNGLGTSVTITTAGKMYPEIPWDTISKRNECSNNMIHFSDLNKPLLAIYPNAKYAINSHIAILLKPSRCWPPSQT